MRKLICFITAVLALAPCRAGTVRNVDISVDLQPNGSARIVEQWNVSQDSGTEWYLVKINLGDIEISDFSVSDETGKSYHFEGRNWNVNRSLSEKAGRCGMVRRDGGYELCWGLGSYGSHVFTVSYTMTNVVKGMADYDCLHMQFISDGLSASPRQAKVTVRANGTAFSADNARIWGFGYNGSVDFASDGSIVAKTSESMSSRSSMILLLRFDKGIFTPASNSSESFSAKLDTAMEGVDFSSEDDFTTIDLISILTPLLAFILGVIALAKLSITATRKKILGVKSLKDIEWSRDVPFKGDLLQSDYVLRKICNGGSSSAKGNTLASAMILQMLYEGSLSMNKYANGKIELSFSPAGLPETASQTVREFYDMMKEASGSDGILQEKEFARWARSHSKRVNKWMEGIEADSLNALHEGGNALYTGFFTPAGQKEARGVIGFRKFLKDFTLTEERVSREVAVWNEYLIFGALFGIADKVAKELGHINPQAFSETVMGDPATAYRMTIMSNRLASSITSANAQAAAKAAGGYGGHSSFGGGGGFSGGGFGGGAR